MAEIITVECFGLRALHGSLVGRHTSRQRRSHPDLEAAEMIGLTGSPLDGVALLHSTSWRWDGGRGLVLTYLCCPDPSPVASGKLVMPANAHDELDEDPSRPSNERASLGDVLHHGIDHLAWLGDHHPNLVAPARGASPELWQIILLAGRHRAGQLHPLIRRTG